jgi:ATP-dependent 26S proteasome regulatory subunit
MTTLEELKLHADSNSLAGDLLEACRQHHLEAVLEEVFVDRDLPEWLTEPIDVFEANDYWTAHFLRKAEHSLIELWLKERCFEEATWFKELWIKWTNCVSNVFILTGNINDYVHTYKFGYQPLTKYLIDGLTARPRENRGTDDVSVITYRLSQGFLDGTIKDGEGSESGKVINRINEIRIDSDMTWEQLKNDFRAIDTVFKEFTDTVILLEGADLIFMNENHIVQNLLSDYLVRWALSPDLAHSRNGVVLTSESSDGLSRHLISQVSKVEVIPIPRPASEKDRLRFLMYLCHGSYLRQSENLYTRSQEVLIPAVASAQWSETKDRSQQLKTFAANTAGLNYIGVEDLFLQIKASTPQGSLSGRSNKAQRSARSEKEALAFINKVKGDILQAESGGLLELVTTTKSLTEDIDGFEEIKKTLGLISRIITNPFASPLHKQTIPMGLLFIGPPGTGKTVVAEAFSSECGMNFLKMGDYRSKWVGESERNLSKILELIKSYTPVIVFMDELDQTEGGRGEGGGNDVDKRLFSKLLQFMSDTSNRGRVLWIAASNRPDIIDPALKRPGRLDMKIPFLPQGPASRRISFERCLRQVETKLNDEEWLLLQQATEYFTTAEIEEVVNNTIRKKIADSADETATIVIHHQDIAETIQQFTPGIETKAFNDMIDVCLKDVTSRELIPASFRNWSNKFTKTN